MGRGTFWADGGGRTFSMGGWVGRGKFWVDGSECW